MLRFTKRLLPSLAAAGILITIGGCADVPTAPAEPGLDVPLAPIATSRGVVSTPVGSLIGPQGGVIQVDGHTLVFPAGALARPTMITMKSMDGIAGVEFGPHGLVFPEGAQPVLTLGVRGVKLSGYSVLAVVYRAPDGSTGEVLAARLSPGGHSVSATIPHFSGYFLAGN